MLPQNQKGFKWPENGQKRPKVAKNKWWKWSKWAKDDQKWPKMAKNDETAENVVEWPKNASSRWIALYGCCE